MPARFSSKATQHETRLISCKPYMAASVVLPQTSIQCRQHIMVCKLATKTQHITISRMYLRTRILCRYLLTITHRKKNTVSSIPFLRTNCVRVWYIWHASRYAKQLFIGRCHNIFRNTMSAKLSTLSITTAHFHIFELRRAMLFYQIYYMDIARMCVLVLNNDRSHKIY